MLSQVSYILKSKNNVNSSVNEVENKDRQNIVLSTWTFKKALLCHLGITDEQCTIEDLGSIININIIDKTSVLNGINITVYQTPRLLLLRASITGNKKQNISLLETFDNIFYNKVYVTTYSGKQICLIDSYNVIKTYDDVSTYYCNLVYPSLNEFDRKMRLLLYNTYYLLYGDEFPQKFDYYSNATGDKLNKRKSKDSNETKFCSDNIFYAYDYSQMIDILFGKDNNESINSKSDWDMFFSDKIDFPNCEEEINEIKRLRNKVAHCKLFPKSDYKRLEYLLTKYNKALDKAIELTYSKDFAKEYILSVKNTLEQMSYKLDELFKILQEVSP